VSELGRRSLLALRPPSGGDVLTVFEWWAFMMKVMNIGFLNC
jgi:hypothetical protein